MNRISNCQPLAVRRRYGPEGFERRGRVVSHESPESRGIGGTDENEAGDR